MGNVFGKPTQNKIILVDVEYDVVNGLIELNRDLVMKLVKQMRCSKKTRNIIGIAKISYEWSKQKIFQWAICESAVDIAVSLRPNTMEECVIRATPAGPHCSFTRYKKDRTVFVNNPVAKGVCQWTVRIAYAKRGYSLFAVGAAPPERLSRCDNSFLGHVKGTFGFSFWKRDHDLLGSWLDGVENEIRCEGTPVPDGSLVSIEADCAQRTLSFFLNDTKVPDVVSEVHVPLFFGVSGWIVCTKSSFASVSFRRLFSATPSTIACTMHRVRME